MSDGAGLILGQNPHCTELNSSQMPEICLGKIGGFGTEWYTIHLMSDLKGDSQFCFPESHDVSRDVFGLVIYNLFLCFPNIPRGLSRR